MDSPETARYPGPLAGVRIVELAGIGPGPFAGMVLADLGADVIGVDRPGGAGPFDLAVLRRGRRSICVDLKSPEGREIVLDLVASADALIEPYRPGVMERLGLGPDECHERNPRLVYARMTGWGQDGPQARYAGHDLTYTATSGLLSGVVRDSGDGTPTFELSTLDGSLLLDGNGQWTGSHWRFRGQARAAPGAEAELDNLLNFFGRRQGALSVISIG